MPSPAVGILVDLSIPKQEQLPPPPLSPPPPSALPPDKSPDALSPIDARRSPSEATPPAEDARGALTEEDLLECETFDFACVSPKSLDGSRCCAEELPGHEAETAAASQGSAYTAAEAAASVCCATGKSTPLRKVKPLSPLKPRQMVELFKEATALACHISINYGSAKKERRRCGGGSPAAVAAGSPAGRRLPRSPMVSPGCRQPREDLHAKGVKEQAWTSMKENIPIHDSRGAETAAVLKDGCRVACISMPPPAMPAVVPQDRRRSGRLATGRASQTALLSRGRIDGIAGDAGRRISIGPSRGTASLSSARSSADAATVRAPAGQLTPRPGSAMATAAASADYRRSLSSSVDSVSAIASAAAAVAVHSRSAAVRMEATAVTARTRRSLAPQGTAGSLGATKTAAHLGSATASSSRRVSAVGVGPAAVAAGSAAASASAGAAAVRRRSSAIIGIAGVNHQSSVTQVVATAASATVDCAVKDPKQLQQPPSRAPYELRRPIRAACTAAGSSAPSSMEPIAKATSNTCLQKPPSGINGGLTSVKPQGTAAKPASCAALSRLAVSSALRPMKAVQPASATAAAAAPRAASTAASGVSTSAGVKVVPGSRAAILPSVTTSLRRISAVGAIKSSHPAMHSTAAVARNLPATSAAPATPKNRRSLLPTRLPSVSLSARTQHSGISEQWSTQVDLGASPVL